MAEVEVGRLEASRDGMAAPAAAGPAPTTATSAGPAATSAGGSPVASAPGLPGPPDRLRALAPIIVFDVAGPLAVYYGARSAGMSTVLALVVSGALPAVRVLATVVQHRRLDAIGALVLSGIALGTVMGLASGSARLYPGRPRAHGRIGTCVLGLFALAPAGHVPYRPGNDGGGHSKGTCFRRDVAVRRVPPGVPGDNGRVGFGLPG